MRKEIEITTEYITLGQLLKFAGIIRSGALAKEYLVTNEVYVNDLKYVDVSKVASYFGGGGHVRAAGCTMNGTFYDVINNISARIELQI